MTERAFELNADLLPSVETLSEPQASGRACVWCAVALSNTTAANFGERAVDAHGSSAHWFPSGCRPCVLLHVYRAQLDHTQTCEQCADEPARCRTGTALRQILKAARR
ncbi:hypothetical protein [Streptomyces sp. NPDC058268]|uniref:hypothetical protein n=1 Tax=Streptomyces sp. NPDC058268 TaxID=3346413 RepID=UPI0036EC43EF